MTDDFIPIPTKILLDIQRPLLTQASNIVRKVISEAKGESIELAGTVNLLENANEEAITRIRKDAKIIKNVLSKCHLELAQRN